VEEAINGYLLDTNVISILFQPTHNDYKEIRANFEAVKDGPVFLPVVAIAEIEFGLNVGAGNPEQAADLRNFFREYPMHLAIDDNTIESYAPLRGQIFRKHGTPRQSRSGFKEKLLEQLIDASTGLSLGIDEKDLLIASVAAQYRLVLATNDSGGGMKRIDTAAHRLEQDGKPIRLRIEYWPK
jgi:predicted nucleic acid-binding protein